MSEKEVIEKSHKGHRGRLKRRFDNSGFKGFLDYEVLELLLTYIIPKQDTKQIAKNLIEKFKTIPNVLGADIKELQGVKGIKQHSARFIKVFNAMVSYYFEQKAKDKKIQFTILNKLVEYLKAVIGNKQNEVMYVLYLNSQNELIQPEVLSEGTVSETTAFPRKIVEEALKYHATAVIVAHNHPGGIAEPSDKDNLMTREIKNALQTVNISLQEHIIIANKGFYSYRKNGYLD